MQSTNYKLKVPDVVSDILEGEAVVVNLVRGIYFSMRGTAAEIWQLFVDGHSLKEINQYLEARYLIRPQDTLEVEKFLNKLLEEDLLVKTDASPPTLEAPPNSNPVKFEVPLLETFKDMQELLVLDPIHEVNEEAGWPHARA